MHTQDDIEELRKALARLRAATEDLADEAETTARVHGREYDMADLRDAAEHARAVLAKGWP